MERKRLFALILSSSDATRPFKAGFYGAWCFFSSEIKRKLSFSLCFSLSFCDFAPKRENQDYGRNRNKKKAYSRGSPCVARCSPTAQGGFSKRNERMVAGTATWTEGSCWIRLLRFWMGEVYVKVQLLSTAQILVYAGSIFVVKIYIKDLIKRANK